MQALNVIRIKNAVFYAYHGVMENEQNLGGKFEVDVDLRCDLATAAQNDKLGSTVDYEAVYGVVQTVVLAKKYFLLEALAGTIARGILQEFPNVDEVTVRLRKPHPPVKGVVDYVEIEITRTR